MFHIRYLCILPEDSFMQYFWYAFILTATNHMKSDVEFLLCGVMSLFRKLQSLEVSRFFELGYLRFFVLLPPFPDRVSLCSPDCSG